MKRSSVAGAQKASPGIEKATKIDLLASGVAETLCLRKGTVKIFVACVRNPFNSLLQPRNPSILLILSPLAVALFSA